MLKKAIAAAAGISLLCMLGGCKAARQHDGEAGDVMNTMFYDFTVNSAYVTDTIGETKAPAGKNFAVVDVSVKNTYDKDLDFHADSLQIQWDDPEEEESEGSDQEELAGQINAMNHPGAARASASPASENYVYPRISEEKTKLEESELSETTSLKGQEETDGLLIYEVPVGILQFRLAAQDHYERPLFHIEETGDSYFVSFDAEQR
jgi:hypothetical protein